jgi:Protein of unknown function (DUF2490)
MSVFIFTRIKLRVLHALKRIYSRTFSFMPKFCLLILLFLHAGQHQAQNTRMHTYGKIGWYNFFATLNLNAKLGVHFEYQWRRDEYVTNWQQSLLRTGLNYKISPNVLLRAGYGWIETFNYGEIPLNAFGRNFSEHRIYEMAQFAQQEGRFEFTHRLMCEQRFIGKYTHAEADRESSFPLFNRMRYMFRVQAPLKGKEISDKTPYLAIYDEVMIGFGKNLGVNVFDQNRIGALIGYRKSQALAIEIGYLHQMLQFGRMIDGKNVFQRNSGIIFNLLYRIDMRKKTEEIAD